MRDRRSEPPLERVKRGGVASLYYRSVHGPARRGGSAWWSVGLIGFCRSLTAALLGHPEVRGSNPRPDTSMRFSSQSFILRLSIEGGGEDGRRTQCGDARGGDTLWTVRSAAAATRDRIPDRGISSLSLVLHPDLLGVQQFHGESVREPGLDVRFVLLVVADRRTGHRYDRHRGLRAASGPRAAPSAATSRRKHRRRFRPRRRRLGPA